MSKLLTAALGAVLVLGAAGAAGAQAQARPDSARRGMRHGQMGMQGDHMGRGGEHAKFMSSLNLSDAQKNQLKTIHAKYEPQVKALRDQQKTQFAPMRAARQKGDTSSAARARFQQAREQFGQRMMAVHQQEMNEVRGILSADQRTKWDAAQAQRKQMMDTRAQGMGKRRGRHGKAGKA